MKTVYEYTSTLSFLKARLGGKNQRKGIKSLLAKSMNCQSSYLSQVLSGKTQLTLEQGSEAADFFQLSGIDKDFFMLLLQKERAGTYKLIQYYQEKIDTLISEKNNLAKRLLNETEDIPLEAMEQYYSSWTYLAVHILTSIPNFNTTKEIGDHLGLTVLKTQSVLEFLVQFDFVKAENGKYSIGSRHLHLEKTNPLNSQHQLNWRLKALENIRSRNTNEIGYAGVFSLSKKDAEKIKEDCIKVIKSNLKIVAPSEEEVMYCSIIDFFEI